MTDRGIVNVVLADNDPNKIQIVMNKLLAFPYIRVTGTAYDFNSIMEKINTLKPHIIFMGFSLIDITCVNVVDRLRELSLDTRVFVVDNNLNDALRENIKAKGVAGVCRIDKIDTINIEEILCNKEKVMEKGSNIKKIQTTILTYNVKGGVGKSTIAVNLAFALRKSKALSAYKVGLIDFDCSSSNISTICNIPYKSVVASNLFHWLDLPEDVLLDDGELASMMIGSKEGLMILPAPLDFFHSSKIDFSFAHRAIKILKKHFDILIIDGAPNISATTDASLSLATHILLITNPERQSVKQLTRFVDLLNSQAIDNKNSLAILNNSYIVINHIQPNKEWGLDITDITRTVNRPFLREIPYSDYVKEALHGDTYKQAIELDNKGDFSLAIKRLANDLLGAYPNGSLSSNRKSIFSGR